MVRKRTTEELVAVKPSPEEFLQLPRHPIVVLLNDVRSLMNVGLCFRVSDAAMIEKLYLTGITGYPPVPGDTRRPKQLHHAQQEIEKTAIKTVPFVPWERRENALELVGELKTKGFQILSLEQTEGSIDYLAAPYQPPLCVILGHERAGVSAELLQASDLRLEIPMYGIGNSHNVAVSPAVVLYEILELIPNRRKL